MYIFITKVILRVLYFEQITTKLYKLLNKKYCSLLISQWSIDAFIILITNKCSLLPPYRSLHFAIFWQIFN